MGRKNKGRASGPCPSVCFPTRRSGCSKAKPYPPGGQTKYTINPYAEKRNFLIQNGPKEGASPTPALTDGDEVTYPFMSLFQPARPNRPEPKRSREEGMGTGLGELKYNDAMKELDIVPAGKFPSLSKLSANEPH